MPEITTVVEDICKFSASGSMKMSVLVHETIYSILKVYFWSDKMYTFGLIHHY